MSDGQYISVRETALLLGVSERKIMDMIESNELKAYKIANQFLRLKKAEILSLQKSGTVENETIQYPYTLSERLKDLLYYNDFYIISVIIVAIFLYIIITG